MRRRDFLKTASSGVVTAALSGCTGRRQPAEDREADRPPNIVIIFTDDQGYGDVGCYGARGFATPHLDRMADEGLKFTDFYVGATVCTPSRAALLTGCYPKRVGLHEAVLFPYSNHGLNPEETLIPELLKTRGYTSICIGKWHLGHHPEFLPLRQGFDEFFGVPYSNDMDGYYYRNIDFQSPPLPLYRNEELIDSGPEQKSLTRMYTEEAERFIRHQEDRPFFLYLAHSMPHLPLHVSEEFEGRSELGLYGDVLEELDWSAGRILRALEEIGIDNNTLIIFTSDNGPVLRTGGGSAGPLRGGKATTWEGGQRVPCIMRWPDRIPAGSISRELVTAMDILPTLAELTGSGPPGRVIDGQDISGILRSPESGRSPHEAFYYYSRAGTLEAVRSGRWKLHGDKSLGWNSEERGPFPISLYDLEKDIGESVNLASEHPEIVDRLKRSMDDFDSRLAAESRPAAFHADT